MIPESEWELTMLEWLGDHGWEPGVGSQLETQRRSLADLVLEDDAIAALRQLNLSIPDQYLHQVLQDVLATSSQSAITENRAFHEHLVKGYRGLTFHDSDGVEQNPTVRLMSADPAKNKLRAVRQVRLVDNAHSRRLDVVLYVNGFPLVVVELKQAGSAGATVAKAHAQLKTYLSEFPMAFRTVAVTVVSDGVTARYGTPFTPLNHMAPWNVSEDGTPQALSGQVTELELLTHGLLAPGRLVDIVRHFTAFDADDEGLHLRIAKPHQYFAVTKAVESTLRAVRANGKAGVVWHTQGSGKSMEMELYAALAMGHPDLMNPTIVVITDRTELDGQLYETFARSTLLPEQPVQIKRRAELRSELANRNSGGIYFTTLQKFARNEEERFAGDEHPLLTARHNVIVIVDEAHRSHYDDLDGYARHLKDALPNATLIAFTGTPVNAADHNTREVFGDYIDVYDLTRAVEDGATVPVYFEPRLIKVGFARELGAEELDAIADEQAQGLDDAERARIEQSVAVINAIYGAPTRLRELARDIVDQWEARRSAMAQALQPSDSADVATPHGKALIVGATREICARLYDEIIALRPDWHSDDLAQGVIKVVYSGSASDQPPISNHVRRDSENKVIKNRLKDIDDPLELVIVKDMMLTGFDAPPLHTLFLDRPMKGALLMQTLARVNRTFRGKQDGLLVAYAPLTENLAAALQEYTVRDQQAKPVGRNVDEAAAETRRLVQALDELLAGFDWRSLLAGTDPHRGQKAVGGAVDHLRSPHTPGNRVAEGETTLAERYRRLAALLSRMWALSAGSSTLDDLRPDVRFFEEVRVWMAKMDAAERAANGEPIPDDVIRVLKAAVAEATAAGDVMDIYSAAGLNRPDIRTFTREDVETLSEQGSSHLAIEALRAMLLEDAAAKTAANVVRRKQFSERISDLMAKYTNQQLTAAEVMQELWTLSQEVAAEDDRGKRFQPPLGDDELAFYDAVADNESAREIQGDETLAQIARELVSIMRRDIRTDWTRRDDVQAKLRAEIRRLLRKYKYPPDKQAGAVKLVIEQMEVLAPRFEVTDPT